MEYDTSNFSLDSLYLSWNFLTSIRKEKHFGNGRSLSFLTGFEPANIESEVYLYSLQVSGHSEDYGNPRIILALMDFKPLTRRVWNIGDIAKVTLLYLYQYCCNSLNV